MAADFANGVWAEYKADTPPGGGLVPGTLLSTTVSAGSWPVLRL